MNILTKEEIGKIVDTYQRLIESEKNLERKDLLIQNKKEFEEALIKQWAKDLK